MAQEVENKIIPYSQHYLYSSELLGNKYQADKIFQYLFDRFLYNYRSNNKDTGMFLFSKQKIEQSTGVERHTISKGLKRLMDLGLISAEGNSCIVYYSYYNAVIRLFSFANSDDKITIKKAFDSCDKEELERLGVALNDENIDNEIATLSRGGINIPSMVENYHDGKKLPSMVKSCQDGKKLPSMVENYHDGKKLPCFDEDFWNNFTTMVKIYHDGKKLPYDSESFSSSLLEMVKNTHSDVNSNDIQALLIQLGIDFMVKSCQAYGKKLPNTPDFMATFYHSNINNIINNKNQYTERSEVYIKGENKEKVEVEGELEDNEELPDNNKNSLDSFLGNSLGESSSNNQEQSKENSQEEEKQPDIPDCEKFRDSNYPTYSQDEIERILNGRFQPESEIESAIREIWNDITQVEEDEDPVEAVPVKQFGKALMDYIDDKTADNPEYPVTINDLFNTFAFEYFWDNGMWFYKISSSSIKNIHGKVTESHDTETSSDDYETEINSRRRNSRMGRDLYFEAVKEVGDKDDEQLSDMEYVLYRLFSAIGESNLQSELPGSRLIDGRVECIKDIFWSRVNGWAGDANLGHDDVKWMFKRFKQKNKILIIQPAKIEFQEILEWNHQYHSEKQSAEILWKQKMAESQV